MGARESSSRTACSVCGRTPPADIEKKLGEQLDEDRPIASRRFGDWIVTIQKPKVDYQIYCPDHRSAARNPYAIELPGELGDFDPRG
jgi:hypothetical protein